VRERDAILGELGVGLFVDGSQGSECFGSGYGEL